MTKKEGKKSLNKFGNNPVNAFFNLGNKVTNGDPVQKAKFDYYLYWIVFSAFVYVAIHYYVNFFTTWKFTYLMWGLIISGISWFNYWGLVGFRGVYIGQVNARESLSKLDNKDSEEIEFDEDLNADDMLKDFGDDKK